MLRTRARALRADVSARGGRAPNSPAANRRTKELPFRSSKNVTLNRDLRDTVSERKVQMFARSERTRPLYGETSWPGFAPQSTRRAEPRPSSTRSYRGENSRRSADTPQALTLFSETRQPDCRCITSGRLSRIAESCESLVPGPRTKTRVPSIAESSPLRRPGLGDR